MGWNKYHEKNKPDKPDHYLVFWKASSGGQTIRGEKIILEFKDGDWVMRPGIPFTGSVSHWAELPKDPDNF